jgi:hypothetical protein
MDIFWNTLSQEIKPRFHELSIYLIAFSFCWLFLFHPELRDGYFMFFGGFGSMSPLFLALGLIVTGGLLLSLVQVFIRRKKTTFEKTVMGWFVLAISGVASFFVGAEMLPSRSAIQMILVAWNIIMSVFLLIQMGMQKYDVIDEDISFVEIFITTTILFIVLVVADRYLHFSWAVTLSISIFYSTSIAFIISWVVNYFDVQLPGFLKNKDSN